MTAITPRLKLWTSQEDSQGASINSLVLEHNGNNYQFHGGTRDIIHAYAQGITIYVLTVNKALGTMGLNAFMAPEPDPINMYYMHTPHEIVDRLGTKWERLSPKAIVERLITYLI